MEGITDGTFRRSLLSLYPDWSSVSTDFLRLQRIAFPPKVVKKHLGNIHSKDLIKTIFQILLNAQCELEANLGNIIDTGIRHLDINMGCPSKKVIAHQGGSYLLSRPDLLSSLAARLRKHWPGFLSFKIRLGLKDTQNFFEILKILLNEGADAITIHARTQGQGYKGAADWHLLRDARELFPNARLIANGDICTLLDIREVREITRMKGVMLGRGALMRPNIARRYWENLDEGTLFLENEWSLEEHLKEGKRFFEILKENYEEDYLKGDFERFTLSRFKSIIKYYFSAIPRPERTAKALRSRSLKELSSAFET